MQGAVTFSFDDGYEITHETTVTCLQNRGLTATYNVITDCVGAVFEGLPTARWSQWRQAERLGHEIASHSATHTVLAGPLSDLRRLLTGLRTVDDRPAYLRGLLSTARALRQQPRPVSPLLHRRSSPPTVADLAASRSRIERALQTGPVESFVYPAGRHDAASRRAVAAAGFTSGRTLDWGMNDSRCDLFALRAVALGPALGLSDLDTWLARTLSTGAWLIVVLHLVAARKPNDYPYFCSLSDFERLLDTVQSQRFWVAPQRQAVRHMNGHALTGKTRC